MALALSGLTGKALVGVHVRRGRAYRLAQVKVEWFYDSPRFCTYLDIEGLRGLEAVLRQVHIDLTTDSVEMIPLPLEDVARSPRLKKSGVAVSAVAQGFAERLVQSEGLIAQI